MHPDPPSATAARRAQGAMFLFGFGGAWLAFTALQLVAVGRAAIAALAAIALTTAGLIAYAWRVYGRNRPALLAAPRGPAQITARRMFNVVNVVQWLLICAASSVLVSRGLTAWLVPCIILIVGLHLVPLAYAFRNRAHYVSAAALVVLAVSYPFLAAGGPTSPIGSVGAAVILWASGLWALADHNAARPTG